MKLNFDNLKVLPIKSCDYGSVISLYKVSKEFGLSNIIDEVIEKRTGINVGILTTIMTINRLVDPKAKYKVGDWYSKTALPYLYDIVPDKIYGKMLTETLDYFTDDAIQEIENKITSKLVLDYNIDLSCLSYDITSSYTYSNNSESELVKYGYSRDHRPCLLYTSPSPRDRTRSRMPSSA